MHFTFIIIIMILFEPSVAFFFLSTYEYKFRSYQCESLSFYIVYIATVTNLY